MPKKFVVIGLGSFGIQLAAGLAERGSEVLAIDSDMDKLDDVSDKVTHTVKLDSTDEKALRNQGLREYDAVIVAIGDDFEASLLTVAILQQIVVKRIIVRAISIVHEKILRHLGVKEVILPAVEAAERLANTLLYEKVIDSFILSNDYTIMEVNAPEKFYEKSVKSIDFRKNFSVDLVTVKRTVTRKGVLGIGKSTSEEILGLPSSDMVINEGDVMVVFGTKKAIDGMLKD